jgi:hypothetical protein
MANFVLWCLFWLYASVLVNACSRSDASWFELGLSCAYSFSVLEFVGVVCVSLSDWAVSMKHK